MAGLLLGLSVLLAAVGVLPSRAEAASAPQLSLADVGQALSGPIVAKTQMALDRYQQATAPVQSALYHECVDYLGTFPSTRAAPILASSACESQVTEAFSYLAACNAALMLWPAAATTPSGQTGLNCAGLALPSPVGSAFGIVGKSGTPHLDAFLTNVLRCLLTRSQLGCLDDAWVSALSPLGVSASALWQQLGLVRVLVDGVEISSDVLPAIVDGHALVPLRAIAEAVGAQATWDGSTQTVTLVRGDTTVTLKIGDPAGRIGSRQITLGTPAQIIDGRTMVPLRLIGEAFGSRVNWDESTRTVTIDTGSGATVAGGGLICPHIAWAKATSSYVTSVYGPPDAAFGCSLKTVWNAGAYTASIEAKYTSPELATGVSFAAVSSPATQEIYKIYGSTDGSNWTEMTSATESLGSEDLRSMTVRFGPTTLQYLRIDVNGEASWVELRDVELVTP